MNSILIYCDFDFAKCPIRFTGESWNYTEGVSGRGFSAKIPPHSITNLYIRSMMSPEADGRICLTFRYMKYRKGSGVDRVPLRVTAGTLNQRPKVIEIQDESLSPSDWLTAKVHFQNVYSNFLLIFQIPRNKGTEMTTLKIDDVLVTKGFCQ